MAISQIQQASLASGVPSSVASSALPAGTVLQVVYGGYAGGATTGSSTLTDTGLTASITPTKSTSKVLVLVNQNGCGKASGDTNLRIALFRNSTNLYTFTYSTGQTNNTSVNFPGSASTAYLDSPATTSSTTYKTQFSNTASSGTVYVQGNGEASTIILMEIAA